MSKLNTTELMTGKDGMISVEVGGVMVEMAEAESYAVNMSFNAVDVQPLGSVGVKSVPTGVKVELTISKMVIRDDLDMAPLLAELKKGKIPVYHYQTKVEKPDGQEERLALNNCVPNGTFTLQSITPGEVVKRESSFVVNEIPELISSLVSTYLPAV